MRLDQALEYLDKGFPVIPIRSSTKKPRVKWRAYQSRLPTEQEVMDWWVDYPDDEIAMITGKLSGYVVVDCDNPDALDAAINSGMQSPIRVKTKRGYHLYFKHPKDGIERGPRAGVNSRGQDWPRINGLDFRGDGSYVLVPPSTNYAWEIPLGLDMDEDTPVWKDWRPGLKKETFDFSTLDLSDITPARQFVSEWERTKKFASEHFKDGKIPSGLGNGRNERVMRYASECIMEGYFGAELRVRCHSFTNEFFVDPLDEREFEATVSSMEQSEKRNHPERFNEKGEYCFNHPDRPDIKRNGRERRLIEMKDIADLEAAASSTKFLIEPWLQAGSVTQVHGYSGHGKSMFVAHCMAALASGKRHIGPFEVMGPARVLYLDFEMGRSTIARRLAEMKQIHGDTEDRLQIWTPFVDDDIEMNFHKPDGLQELQGWIEYSRPDVVVIDTIRTAWPGLLENSADEWAKINSLAVKIRNAGIAVVLVHHSNKPGDNGLGREAGSTNQLTTLETQIRVTQVYDDEDTANNNAALFDGNYPSPVFPALSAKLPEDWRLYMCMELRYGKVREWTDLHDRVQWFGLAECLSSDMRQVVSSMSTKQRAKDLSLDGLTEIEIADLLGRPVRTIRSWLSV